MTKVTLQRSHPFGFCTGMQSASEIWEITEFYIIEDKTFVNQLLDYICLGKRPWGST